MDSFDIGIVKREPFEDFHNDTNYFDNMLPYNSSDMFDSSVDWLSSFVEDRSSASSVQQNLDQLNTAMSDYSGNIILTSVNRDQTLNRLNGMTLMPRTSSIEDIPHSTPFPLSYSNSPASPEFDHRLEGGGHDMDYDVKSFYSGVYYGGSQGSENAAPEYAVSAGNGKLTTQLQRELTVPVKLEEDGSISDQERDGSESGERVSNAEELSERCECLDLKSCYDSGAHSPNSDTPGTPPQCLMLGQVKRDRPGSFSSGGDMSPPGDQPKMRQPFFLSDEEKRTLVTEGLPIPSGYPLTKSEERALKKVRRKIKNKISAQESRRKKKEYMETLEKRVEICSNENLDLRKKLDTMEANNKTLINQLQKLQAIVASRVSRPTCANSTQTTNEAPS